MVVAAECVDGGISVASLHLVDLAGSERYALISTMHSCPNVCRLEWPTPVLEGFDSRKV